MLTTLAPLKTLMQSKDDRLAAASKQAEADRKAAEEASRAYSNALVDAAEGRTSDPSAIAGLRKALHAAQEKARDSETVLAGLQARQRSAEAAESRDRVAKAWDKAVALADKRQAAVRELGDTLAKLAGAYVAYQAATAELSTALPAVPDPDAALLRGGAVESAMLTELAKLGLNLGDTTSPSVLHSVPSFMDRFEGLPGVVRAWRDSKGAA